MKTLTSVSLYDPKPRCTCEDLPETPEGPDAPEGIDFDSIECAHCAQLTYWDEITDRECPDCHALLPALEFGDNPEEDRFCPGTCGWEDLGQDYY